MAGKVSLKLTQLPETCAVEAQEREEMNKNDKKVVALAKRESDLQDLAIVFDGKRLIAIPAEDLEINTEWEFFDLSWKHVKSGGLYKLRACVDDDGKHSYLYTSQDNESSWVREVAVWHEYVDNAPRFIPI